MGREEDQDQEKILVEGQEEDRVDLLDVVLKDLSQNQMEGTLQLCQDPNSVKFPS